VAAINSTGALSRFSNYGATTVDLGAPGEEIYSTLPTDTYGGYSGTSMATPHVSGAVALCASMDGTLTARDLRFALLSYTTQTTPLAGQTVSGGRLDVGAMMPACLPPTAPVLGGPSNLSATATGSTSIRLTWTDGATGDSYFEIERSPAGCQSFSPVDSVGADTTAYNATGLTPDTGYCFRVRAGNRLPSVSAWSDYASAITRWVPPPYECSATAFQWQDVSAAPAVTLADDSSAAVTCRSPGSFTARRRRNYSCPRTASCDSTAARRLSILTSQSRTVPSQTPTSPPSGMTSTQVSGGAVRTASVGTSPSRRFVMSWENVPRYDVLGSTLTFQVVLEEATGDAVINYLDVVAGNTAYDQGASATAGVENPGGDAGTLLSYNAPSLSDATAFRCSMPASAVTLTPSVASPATIAAR